MITQGVSQTASSHEPLQERLQDPRVADSLNRLIDKLDSVAFFVEAMDQFVRRGDVIADSLASSVAELRNSQPEAGSQLLEKAPQYLKTGAQLADAATTLDVTQLQQSEILKRLTDPKTLASLNQLLDQLPLIAFLSKSLEEFLARGEVVADNLAGAIREFHLQEMDPAKLVRLMETLPKLQEAGEKILHSELMGDNLQKLMDAGKNVVDSGMLDKQVVNGLGKLTQEASTAYREACETPTEPIGGFWGLMKATKDPDVQKSLGFFFAFAKAFAKNLK